ncbi:MAG: TolC family protein [Candidatus Ratteibacteria bacterium]
MRTKLIWVTLLLLPILFTGCRTADFYSRSADREVETILLQKEKVVQDQRLPDKVALSESTRTETIVVTLKDALISAATENRDYQSKKEDVYLRILDLTYQRWLFRTRYGISGSAEWNNDGTDDSLSASLNIGLVRWLGAGTQMTLNLGQSLLQYLTGTKDKAWRGLLSFDLFQPLLQGSGRFIAEENLTQAERSAIYQIRTFLRYQRNFSVEVASKFFNILLAQNRLANYRNNYIFLKETRERIEMLSQAGRLPAFQADQAKQNEYQAYQQWVEANNNFQSLNDSFKIVLGIPVAVPLVVNAAGFETFFEKGIPPLIINADHAIDLALRKRLDLLTSFDELEDSGRKVVVAQDALRGRLNLSASTDSRSKASTDPTFSLSDTSWSAGLSFALPFDKLSERNALRRSQISLDRAKRSFSLLQDQVKLDARKSFRDLEEAFQTHEIQKNSLELAGKRVESTDLLLQAGRATTRDLLDAQSSFLAAKNSLAGAIVNYLVSYLGFLKDTETLELDERGVWKGDLYEKISGETGA